MFGKKLVTGKGSTRRPEDIDKFQENFDKIFGKRKETKKEKTKCEKSN